MANEHLSSQDIHADDNTLAALRSFLLRQQQHTGQIPTDHDIVVEYFRDAVAEPHVVVHAPFGGRVIGAWATALAAAMEHRYGSQVQFAHDNDGMLFRLPDFEEIPEFDKLLNTPFTAIEKLLIEAIANTPMFITGFRHNATRALLLARSRAGKRIPLWLQRLRAADLLQAVREMPDFPILAETYRECLQDLFDIHSLKIVLDEIGAGATRIHPVRTSSPSPMTAGLLFRFLSEQMYDYDRLRTVGHAADMSSELLADLLARDEIPTIISKELISTAVEHWQHLHPDRQAKDSETCYDIIEKLGPITQEDLAARCAHDPADWLHSLAKQNRIQLTERGWIHTTRMSYSTDDKKELVRRHLRLRGPQTVAQLTAELHMEQGELAAILSTLLEEKEIAHGLFVIGESEEQWCDRDNLSFLYRQAIAARRGAHEPGDRAAFMQFQMHWHHIARPHRSALEVIRQYTGLSFPMAFFERDVLPNRIAADSHDLVSQLTDLVAEGEIVPIADKAEGGRLHVRFNPRGQEHLFNTKEELDERAGGLGTDVHAVYRFLKENGASLYHDIRDGAGLQPMQVDESLTLLCRRGLLSCDHLPSFYAILQNDPAPVSAASWHEQIRQPWSPSQRRRDPALRHDIKSRLRGRQGRWFLTSSYAVMGKALPPEKRAEAHARLLLQRYGIVVKEFYRHEQGLAPWYAIFQVLKRMEWSGEIRRGYFIAGFSGVQFASHEALQVLEQQSSQPSGLNVTCLLSAIDPALPFGGQLAWGFVSNDGAIAVVRSSANHVFLNDGRPLAYLENWGARLYTSADAHKMADLPELMKRWLRQPEPWRPRKKLELAHIDGRPAAKHDLAALFSEHGFELDGDSLVLWPSNLIKTE